MKKSFAIFCILSMALAAFPIKAAGLSAGDLIKASQAAVYYYGADGKRYVFPNEKTYDTWYADFSSVKTITDAELAAISIGGNVTYRPGVKMIKITTDPKVYIVSGGGVLRWVRTETMAITLYGTNWNEYIEDVPDAFFTNYTVGADITLVGEFIPVNETAEYTTIDMDKAAAVASKPIETVKTASYIWTQASINADAHVHKNLDFVNYNGGFLASWNDDRNGQLEVYYQKTDATTAADGDAVRISDNISDSTNAKAYYEGTDLYFLWEDSSLLKRAIYIQRRDILGSKWSQGVFASTTYATSKYPDFDYNAALGEYGVAWWDSRSAPNSTLGDIYFVRMEDGVKTGATAKVSEDSVSEFSPQIVSVDDKFAIVWQDDNFKIKFALVDENSALSGSIISIATASKAVSPKIAWNGQNFGVVWTDKSGAVDDAYFALLDADGTKVSAPTAIASDVNGASEPDILWTGSKFYISYTGITEKDIYLAKAAESGKISEKDINISDNADNSYSSRLTKSSAGTIAIAWLEDDGLYNKIVGAIESAAGN